MNPASTGMDRLPGLRVVARVGPLRLLRLVAAVYVIGFAAFVLINQPPTPFGVGGDVMNYFAAGQRLNDGHPLYRLSPGDFPVPIVPPYWTVPLASPPPIAVLWRPLAALGATGAILWWLGGIVAMGAMVWTILRRGTGSALIAAVVLTPAIALTAATGNANAYLVPLLFAAWSVRDRPWLVGGAIALAASVKLTPILLVGWLVVTRRYRAVVATTVACVALVLLGLVGAGWQANLDWFAAAVAAAPTHLSLAGLTGLPDGLVAAAVALAAVGVAVVSRRDGIGFGSTVAGAALGSPAFYFAPIAMLAATLAPVSPPAEGDG